MNKPKTVTIDVYQQDFMAGFASFLADGSAKEDGKICRVALNLGSILACVAQNNMEAKEVPYFVAESLMHECIHVLEEWANVTFSEERVEKLIEKYAKEANKY